MNTYLVDFTKTATEEAIEAYLTANGCTKLTTFSHFDNVYHVESKSVPPAADIVESVIADSARPLKLLAYDAVFNNDPVPTVEFDTAADQNWWKVASLKTPVETGKETHRLYGEGTVVYIVDSGIQADHPEFEGVDITLLYSFISNFEDKKGHGTAMASVISGKTCGLTKASIKVVKMFDPGTATLQSDLLAAFDAIAQDYSTNPKPSVVNLSWSIAKNAYVEEKLQSLINLGILVVAASGNDGQAIQDVTPASMAAVATIGSYSKLLKPSDFSNYTGSAVAVTENKTNIGALDGWAPGEDIYCATLGGTYGSVAGTSVAAAIHSGAFAYNLERFLVDGSISSSVSASDLLVIAQTTSLGREGVLNLGGQYSNSVNKITTYFSHPGDAPAYTFGSFAQLVVGTAVHQKLFDPTTWISATTKSDFPTGLSINNGVLTGTPEDIAKNYIYQETIMTLTSSNGETREMPLNIVIQKAGYDYYSVAKEGDDPKMDIALLTCAFCCIQGFPPGTYCYAGSECGTCDNTGPYTNPKTVDDCVCR